VVKGEVGKCGGGGWQGRGAFDYGRLNACSADALSCVVRAAVPIHADAAGSVFHSTSVSGFDAGVLGPY